MGVNLHLLHPLRGSCPWSPLSCCSGTGCLPHRNILGISGRWTPCWSRILHALEFRICRCCPHLPLCSSEQLLVQLAWDLGFCLPYSPRRGCLLPLACFLCSAKPSTTHWTFWATSWVCRCRSDGCHHHPFPNIEQSAHWQRKSYYLRLSVCCYIEQQSAFRALLY